MEVVLQGESKVLGEFATVRSLENHECRKALTRDSLSPLLWVSYCNHLHYDDNVSSRGPA